MLLRWSIENFKSFLGRTDIDLAPISVFAGANSSGKSTIIQSILLLKQTIQYAPANRPLALNGPLLKLGTFDDVKNVTSEANYIGISWDLDVETWQHAHGRYPYSPWGAGYYFGEQSITSVSAEFQWDIVPLSDPTLSTIGELSGSNELLKFQPRLAFSVIDVHPKKKDATVAHLRIGRSPEVMIPNYPFNANIDSESQDELLRPKPDGRIIGASSTYFFPGQLVIEYDAVKERARRTASVLMGDDTLFSWTARDVDSAQISPEVVRHIQQWFSQSRPGTAQNLQLFDPPDEQSRPIQQVVDMVRRNIVAYRAQTPNLGELRRDLEELLAKGESPKRAADLAIPQAIGEAVTFCSQYFRSSVRYLGPLRDEPKPVYPLEALANPTEVGYKGEHTAAVLDLHRDLRIRYTPSSFVSGKSFPRNQISATLHDAVVDWLSYVGVASEVATSEYGKFGHQMTVQTEGLNRFHDLTNVGVGVSQVLPIIVMALLAEKPSLLIFEQPELHLHPKVQARLADFFLSVALSGKQCLIETHSEYLIERFRRRVAEAEGESLTSLLKIYFTERVGGETKCRAVEVTKYGAIPNWPQDFFDQSQYETEQILQAATEKRAAERDKKNP
jgi:predicted ATPase